MTATPPNPPQQRSLHVNMNTETEQFLRHYMAEKGTTATEATRRAFGLLKFFEDELAAGRVFHTARPDGTGRLEVHLMQ